MTRAQALQRAVPRARRLAIQFCLVSWCAAGGCDADDEAKDGGEDAPPEEVSCPRVSRADPAPPHTRTPAGFGPVPKASICDGIADCYDGADEIPCPDVYLCEPLCHGVSICAIDGSEVRAVPNAKRCDNHADCPLADDERDCPGSEVVFCARDDYGLMSVYEPTQVCDGVQDCYWAEDEKECPGFFECRFTGPGVESVTADKVCDGKRDCHLGNDEENCPAQTP